MDSGESVKDASDLKIEDFVPTEEEKAYAFQSFVCYISFRLVTRFPKAFKSILFQVVYYVSNKWNWRQNAIHDSYCICKDSSHFEVVLEPFIVGLHVGIVVPTRRILTLSPSPCCRPGVSISSFINSVKYGITTRLGRLERMCIVGMKRSL